MPQLDFDGANSKVSADKIQGQSGTTVTVPTGHKINSTDATGIEMAGTAVKAGDWTLATQVAPSTSGNVLTSTGSAWASSAAAGGAWTEKVALTTATGVTAIDLTNLTKTIKIFIQITAVQTDADSIWMRTSTNNGSSFAAGGTDYERNKIVASDDDGSTVAAGGGEFTRMILGGYDGGNEETMPVFHELTVFNPQLNSHTIVTALGAGFTTNGTTGENFALGFMAGCRDAAEVVNAVRIGVDESGTDTFDATYFVIESSI